MADLHLISNQFLVIRKFVLIRWLLNSQPESFHPTLFHFPEEEEQQDVCISDQGPSKAREKRGIPPPPRDVSVNVTAILNSLAKGYDKRIRPNYGGEYIGENFIALHWICIN